MDNNNAKIVLPFYRLLNLDDLLYLDSSEPYLPTLLFEEEKKKKKKSDTLAAIDNSNYVTDGHGNSHLCFKQTHPKMCNSPKFDDGVKN